MSRERRKCLGGCGRWLTNAASIALGYGRQCAEAHGITPAPAVSGPRRPRPVPRPDTPPEVHPDQTALELHPDQTTEETP